MFFINILVGILPRGQLQRPKLNYNKMQLFVDQFILKAHF